jgi:hypothetical protein
MSSPLDNRIRTIAREEASALVGAPDGIATPTPEQMQQQITDLHEHLHHAAATISGLSARLDVLEKVAGQADTARRTARKTTG